ncbi:MAG: LLM class flavin-dependent oxidoreductase [Gammaproteobacteria bacterium WSBS_2016_MAG_OTU1]
MKISLFAHLQQVDDTRPHEALYEDFLALCHMADEGGMHAIWTGEHHGMDFTITPNPFINIADLARRTQHVRLGTGTIVAPFWHPIKLAGEAAMTDIICGGRLDIGIARGAYSYEYERLLPGMDAWQAGQRMREIIPAVQKLWAGDYAHQGEFYQFPTTTSMPTPLQKNGPPLWVAARDPSSHDFAVANNCNVQVTPLWLGAEEVDSLMQKFNTACANNTQVSRPKIMVLQHAFVGKNDDEAAAAAESLSKFYCYFGAWFQNKRAVNRGRIASLTADEMAAIEMYSPENMRKNQIVGTAEEVIERLRQYEQWGYDEYAFWIDSGMTFAQKRDSLARFIDEVMPQFA